MTVTKVTSQIAYVQISHIISQNFENEKNPTLRSYLNQLTQFSASTVLK